MHKLLTALSTADIKAAPYWPWQAQSLLFALIVASAIGSGWVFWVAPAQQQLALKMRQETELKARYQQLAVNLNELNTLMQQQATLKTQRSDWLAVLPEQISTADFVQVVTGLGTANKLVFVQFALGESESLPLWSALPFSLLLQGSYQDFISFLEALASLEQPVTLHDFKLSKLSSLGGVPALLELKIDAKALHQPRAGAKAGVR